MCIRDSYFSVLGIIAGSIERFATEIRHLQRSEVYELQEFFSKGQKGSSAMPHKKNPILSLSLIHISEPTRPLYISYAVFCLKKKKAKKKKKNKKKIYLYFFF